jgi:hypothetical protein
MTDEKLGEVVSFPEASILYVLARKEVKLKKVQEAFKAASNGKFKDARNQRRKRKNSKKKK